MQQRPKPMLEAVTQRYNMLSYVVSPLNSAIAAMPPKLKPVSSDDSIVSVEKVLVQ